MKDIIKTLIVMVGVVLCVWLVSSNRSTPQVAYQPQYDRTAMINAWNICLDAEKNMDWNKRPSLRIQYQTICNVSLQGGSPTFKQGYISYCEALNDLITYYETEVPADFLEGVGMGAWNTLTKGELDGGANRMQQTLTDKYSRFQHARQIWRVTLDE